MKINTIPLRTSLGLTILLMGLFSIALVFFSGETYRQLAIENQRNALVDLIGIKVDDLLARLEDNAAKLGLEIQYDKHFRKIYKNKEWNSLQALLDNRFHQYFVTAGILRLEKIQILDQDFNLVSEFSKSGLPSNQAGNCPGADKAPALRTGANRLKPYNKLCVDGYTPYLSVTVPIGLRPEGYIRVVTDPTHDLKRLETELGMPLKLSLINGDISFTSSSWTTLSTETSSLVVDFPLISESGQHVVTASHLVDVKPFFEKLSHTRNMVMLVVGFVTIVTVMLVRLLSEKLILKPLQSLCFLLRRSGDKKSASKELESHGVISEFAELKELYSVLEDMALTDSLTGLANRAQFERHLKSINSDHGEEKQQHAICFMDLDRFKIVNDTCGHAAGDNLLQQIGQLFRDNVRNEDLVARIGGDEFAILLENCPSDRAKGIAETIRKAIETYRFFWDNQLFNIGVSIGVVPFKPGGYRFSDLVSAADTACYIAKGNGRNRVHLFRADDIELKSHRSEMRWATRITQALGQNRFELFSQPITATDNWHDAPQFHEILLTMYDEDGNFIQPSEFIPAAEKYNLIMKIDKWVISNLCNEIDKFRKTGNYELPVYAISLSGQSLSDEKFLHYLIDTLDTSDIPNENICFEITETSAIVNLTKATRFISILRGMGIRFSLGDFGSGLSSFNSLKNLKVDYVKIDSSFVRGMVTNEVDFNMVNAINQMAQIMGIMTIAEAVENKTTLDKLKEIGVDFVMGHFIGEPVPLVDSWQDPATGNERKVVPLHKH
jgi:diguanylate cyclase (GGDEF)-like protein